MPWLVYANLSISCCQEEQPCLPLPAPITSPVSILVPVYVYTHSQLHHWASSPHSMGTWLSVPKGIEEHQLEDWKGSCSGSTYLFQAPYMMTVCAELSLIHPDPSGDTAQSGQPTQHLHRWSKNTSHVSDMKDTCSEVHLCVTIKITEYAETVLDKYDHSAGCTGLLPGHSRIPHLS